MQYKDNNQNFIITGYNPKDDTSFVNNGLDEDTWYFYKVQASNSADTSSKSMRLVIKPIYRHQMPLLVSLPMQFPRLPLKLVGRA